MSKAGKKIIRGLRQAVAVAQGKAHPARVHFKVGAMMITAIWDGRNKTYIAVNRHIPGLLGEAPTIDALKKILPERIAYARRKAAV